MAESSLLEEGRGYFKTNEKLWLMSASMLFVMRESELTLSKTPRLICDEAPVPARTVHRCGSSRLKSKSELRIQWGR